LVVSLISKMRSSLSMRGMIRGWWKLAMTDVTPNPETANWRRAVVRDSSLICLEEGDTSCTQAPGFSLSTVDGPYNKDLTVKTSGLRGVYSKFHALFLY
jgi:hypothetical protein